MSHEVEGGDSNQEAFQGQGQTSFVSDLPANVEKSLLAAILV